MEERVMKIIIKNNGKVVREKTLRNELHFEVQKKTRMNIVQSKKMYNRKKEKKIKFDY